jgi:ribosomal protein S13
MRANEFNIGDKIIDKYNNMVIEILDKYSSGNIKYKCLDKGKYPGSDINVGKTYTSSLSGINWEKISETVSNISSKAIQEMQDKISENEKNLAEMKKTLEKMKIQNKVSFKVGDMISFMYDDNEYRGIVVKKDSEESVKILQTKNTVIGNWDFTNEDITNIEILNSKKQKEMAKMVLDFYNGRIPE